MAEKQGDLRSRTVGWLAAAAAGFVARKVTIFAWTRITGKVPPDDPQDPEVAPAPRPSASQSSWALAWR